MIKQHPDKSSKQLSVALFLFLAGAITRFLLAFSPVVSSDAATWQLFAESIRAHGLGYTYDTYSLQHSTRALFNHPPLAGLAVAGLLWLSDSVSFPFANALKLVTSVADIGIGFMVFRLVEHRTQSRTFGWWSAALYSLGLCQMMFPHYLRHP